MQNLGDDDDVSAYDGGGGGDGGGGEQSSMRDGTVPPARPPLPARRARPARATAYEVQPQAAIHAGSTPAGKSLLPYSGSEHIASTPASLNRLRRFPTVGWHSCHILVQHGYEGNKSHLDFELKYRVLRLLETVQAVI